MSTVDEATSAFTKVLNRIVKALDGSLAKIPAGPVDASMLRGLTVDTDGIETPLTEVASIDPTDDCTLTLQPYDKDSMTEVGKVIRGAGLEATVQEAGDVLHVVFPPMTEARQAEVSELVATYGSDAKESVQQALRHGEGTVTTYSEHGRLNDTQAQELRKRQQDLAAQANQQIDAQVAHKQQQIQTLWEYQPDPAGQ
ncbi:ribosome-recycling factor [Streptomyces hydrogenans]|uniref:ribosome-recycling factor n=1 Tax=Streptomyces hydrogenans TaxID=1873719 RepID=UPI00278C2BC3|nr:ribosome-recycling factor [Streptomyces hydrogenans]